MSAVSRSHQLCASTLQEKGPAVSLNWNCLDDAQQILKEDQDSGQLAMQNPEGSVFSFYERALFPRMCRSMLQK